MKELSINSLQAIVLDFDGVLTDNSVFVTEDGVEMVKCNRSDGLAFEALNKIGIKSYILSTETNGVVGARAKKLNIRAISGVANKPSALKALSKEESFDLSFTLYVGNDLNDYHAIKLCGFSACPLDGHKLIQEIVTYNLESNGGSGVVRELVEKILNINILRTLYN
jgi:3-deoxy-D-manno-octulosonate 8-phosphate phosphatase (KDO 8-P phosphatase)